MPMNEADTRARLIDPALYRRGWTDDLVRREQTAGAIEVVAGQARQRARGKVDYLLRTLVNVGTQPVALALIEAKAENHAPGHGLEQAKRYAARFQVKFVYSSNGHLFVEYDAFSGLTSAPRPMDEFPTPQDLRQRYEQGMGFGLTSEQARPLLQPYTGGEGTRRYYQDAAIRATMEKIALCQTRGEPARALLSLATGAGKTFIAVNLLKRIADAGLMTRALFVCDRDELRSQALGAFQNVFGANAAEVYRDPDGRNHARNARVHIATYQTLGIAGDGGYDGESSNRLLSEFYPENHFSHVVIDECHRSAWGKWSTVLTRNAQAVHIGLTATPRHIKGVPDAPEADVANASAADDEITANNYRYFGEPVYTYDMAQAIEDGYLAACEIVAGRVSLDETGVTAEDILVREPRDADTGEKPEPTRIRPYYGGADYENRLLLPDRVAAMCQDLFDYLLESGGPEQKTIIFCARDRHADDVAVAMNNLYAEWCREHGQQPANTYAFKCTAASSGNDQLPDLRGASRSHFVATTVDLLTTGVDVPCVRNIVFFRYVKSPISFYQMVGRGTRLDPPTRKLMFTIYDYTGVTRLFGEEFISAKPRASKPPQRHVEWEAPISVDGFDVVISEAGRYIMADVDGRALPVPVDEYKARLAQRLVQEVPTLDAFRSRWIDPAARQALLDALVTAGYSPGVVQMVEDRQEYDLYDVLADLGWGMAPRTRQERSQAFGYKQEAWLSSLAAPAAATIRAIAGQFALAGTDGLESLDLFRTREVQAAGGLGALRAAGDAPGLVLETKRRMFSA